jgi:hypothetical protein
LKGTVSPSSNYLYDGFTMISNLIMDNQVRLNITNEEFAFIVKIYRNVKGYKIHDSALDSTVSTRTLQRRRKSLKDKGLIKYTVYRKRDDSGHITTDGISYDLSPLEEKLQAIHIENLSKKELKVEKIQKEYILDDGETEEDSPLEKYRKDWFEEYGTDYNITKFEADYYNRMNSTERQRLCYIFDMVKENGEMGKIVPRLSLFFKVPVRMAQLREYTSEKVVSEESDRKMKEALEFDDKLEKFMKETEKKYIVKELTENQKYRLDKSYREFCTSYLNGRYDDKTFEYYTSRCAERIQGENNEDNNI